MNTYTELKKKHAEEVNNIKGLFFAFSNEQFKKGMEKVGLTEKDTSKIYYIGAGGYIRKEDASAMYALFERHEKERKELKKEEKTILEALVYELKNHEFCITGDYSEALNALGWSENEIDVKILKKACKLAM